MPGSTARTKPPSFWPRSGSKATRCISSITGIGARWADCYPEMCAGPWLGVGAGTASCTRRNPSRSASSPWNLRWLTARRYPMKPLKVGLLVDDTFSNKYDYELALWAKDQANIRISHLIVHLRRDPQLRRLANTFLTQGPCVLLSKILFRLIVSLENLFLKRSSIYGDHYKTFDLSKLVDEIEKIKALDLDVLIRCGTGILHGDILHASRLGIISFHHGDNRINRGSPAGFWESYYEWPQTGFIIQRLTEDPDAGEVLVRGSFRTRLFYSLNQAHLYKKANIHLKRLLNRIALTDKLPSADNTPNPYSGIHYRTPKLHQSIAYGFKVLKRIAVRKIPRMLTRGERWGISLLSSRWDKAVFWRSTEVRIPRGRFWADPFLYSYQGRTFCFVEDFVYKAKRAHITALEITGTEVVERGIAVKEPFHLSFPFLFQYKGGLYMCPECFESGQIRIYRCVEFPLKWELQTVAMEGVSAVDTLLFEKEGKWWMLTSLDESGTGDYCSELYLFSSDSPLDTNWTPHPQNPIRIDACGGRNAGLIIEGEKLFRVAQRQGFDQYGQGILVYEIKKISESIFVEELVSEINPAFRRGLRGTHHLSTDGRTTVIDHYR